MLAFYIVPTEAVILQAPNGTPTGIERRPVGTVVARGLPNWRRSWAYIPDGSLVPYTLFVVDADSFAALDALAETYKLGEGARLGPWLDADLVSRSIPQRLRDRLQALSLSTTNATRRDLFYRIAHRLEGALDDLNFERIPIEQTSSITDDFAGTGALGSGWVEVSESTAANGLERVAGKVQTVGSDYGRTYWRRTESAFPDDQYAQLLVTFQTSDPGKTYPAVRLSATGAGYVIANWGTAGWSLYRHNGTGTLTYLTETTHVSVVTTNYTVKLQMTGTTFAAFKDGGAQGSTTDSTYASGKPGMYGLVGGGGGIDSDDFECTDASGGAAFGDTRSHMRGMSRGMFKRLTGVGH